VKEAQFVAERVRAAVAGHSFLVEIEEKGDGHEPLSLRVTASLGIASLPDDADSPEKLVEIADRALYDAKHQGRNRVVVAHLTSEETQES